jgi:hypothetical protein
MILSLNGLVKLYSPQLEAVMLLLLCSSSFSLRSSLSVTHYDDEEEISFSSSSLVARLRPLKNTLDHPALGRYAMKAHHQEKRHQAKSDQLL